MSNSRKKVRRLLWLAQAVLLLLCISIYLVDWLRGDGDGIIEKWRLNPVSICFWGQVFLLPLLGLTSRKELIVNGSLLLLSMILMVLGVEQFLQVVPLNRTTAMRIENVGGGALFSRYDTVYFKNYMPHAHFVTHIEEETPVRAIENRINSHGIRGPEIGPKRAGEKRTLLLGDSFLQSDEVAYENTVGQLLEQMLGDSQLVIQHGNPSWSPLLELNWLIRQGPALELDRVVLFLYYNDFFPGQLVGDEGYTPFARFDSQAYPRGFDFSSLGVATKRSAFQQFREKITYWNIVHWYRSWKQRRQLLRQVPGDQLDVMLNLPPAEFAQAMEKSNLQKDLLEAKLWGLTATFRDTSIWDTDTQERLALSEHYLSLMQEWLSQREIELSLVLIPYPWQFAGENLIQKQYYGWDDVVLPRGGLEDRLRTFAEQRELPFLPLYPAFEAFNAREEEPLYFRQDGHWTPTGHRLAAEQVQGLLIAPQLNNSADE